MKSGKSNKLKYLCVDTNIFVQCCLLEIDGDNLDVLTKLHKLLDQNKIKLLLPEVIKLEFHQALKRKTESLINQIGKHKGNINTDSFNKKIKEDLIEKLEQYAEEKRKISEKVKEEIESIFSHKNTIQDGLQLTPQIFVEAYRMSLNGDKPFDKDRPSIFQQDCLIIEALRSFLKDKSPYEFYFCSQNKSDFADINPKKAEALDVHGDIQPKFSHISYYENLGTLLNQKLKTKVSKETIEKLGEKKLLNNLNEGAPIQKELLDVVNTEPGLRAGERFVDPAPGEPK